MVWIVKSFLEFEANLFQTKFFIKSRNLLAISLDKISSFLEFVSFEVDSFILTFLFQIKILTKCFWKNFWERVQNDSDFKDPLPDFLKIVQNSH